MAKKTQPSEYIPVETIRHVKEERLNIPTNEQRGFVSDDEKAPKTILYPRDPSLDPQLVWKNKDIEDQSDLAVPAVPLYIQEQIQPRAIIDSLRQDVQAGAEELNLFSDFNGLTFEEKIDFYHHGRQWTNRMILGDSLLVMNSLAEKENLKGQVQMIYIDPPYGIKFGSNWQVSTRKREVKDGKADDATRQPEQIKAFRDTWKLGIHSYLSYLRDRLVVARELLTDSGSVFVQIGDENVHLVRCLLDEVFGSENFCSLISFTKSTGTSSSLLPTVGDYILWYCKDISTVKYRQLFWPKGNELASYTWAENTNNGQIIRLGNNENWTEIDTEWNVFSAQNLRSQGVRTNTTCSFEFQGRSFHSGASHNWKTHLDGLRRLSKANRLIISGSLPNYKRYVSDFPVYPITNQWEDTAIAGFSGEEKTYIVQTATRVIARCILMTTDPGDLVLDPTCGSGTTAYVAEQWGRRWITIDTSRVALALARTRLMSAKYPYYYLADSPEGQKKLFELTGQPPLEGPFGHDIKKGFVYKRVPHITLKSIANNAAIDTIYDSWQEKLTPMLDKLNQALKTKWEEWEVPFEADAKWSEAVKKLHADYLAARRARQTAIDECIQQNADYEILYDQPAEDKKTVRVAGPFTVESLSPYRMLEAEERPASETVAQRESDTGDFVRIILDHLKKAGVQNTVKSERLKFDRLDPFPGEWLQATGEYTDNDGKVRRVAVTIGPATGTVGPDQVHEAAKEAVQGLGHDILLVCGFAFDPHVSEESKRYGKLTVLPTRINPDLLMGDTLKNTGAGNLFMVFGEPDITLAEQPDGKLTVTIHGVDIYDPTTGQIRSSSTDEIACWFLDTNYSGDCFNVRHAYFTGGQEPYESLKKALRANIDETAWQTIYSTVSRPFNRPEKGKIAVKVINHYGDEVLKVFTVGKK